MNYVLKPTLEYIVLVKIAATLWNQNDIKKSIDAKNPIKGSEIPKLGNRHRAEWKEIEGKVILKVSQISQPANLKERILEFIHPIGSQILQWIEYHNENPYFGANVPDEFCWTPQGTIDKKKTAEMCVKDERIDIIKRYRLACNYCLKNDIAQLWEQLPERQRRQLCSEIDSKTISESELLVCCTYDMKGVMSKLNNRLKGVCSPYVYAVEHAAGRRNKAAVDYFLQKLTDREREESLVCVAVIVASRQFYTRQKTHTCFSKENCIEVLCFLLSQMNNEQQKEVFKTDTFKALCCFLDWPWQSVFIETANRMWSFLSKDDYYGLLITIINKEIDNYQDYNYRKLFREFWEQSPAAYKKYCIGMCTSDLTLLSKLFEIEDRESIELIFQNTTLEDKEGMIFKHVGMDLCTHLFYKNERRLLKVFVQECISSKNVMLQFEKKFKIYMMSCHSEEYLEEEKDSLKKFFQLLDDFIN